jgi:hypothetical protein
MPDIVLDTNALADFLAQYFGPAERGQAPFQSGGRLSLETIRPINRICRQYGVDGSVTNLVIASSLAFVEIVRQWDEIV